MTNINERQAARMVRKKEVLAATDALIAATDTVTEVGRVEHAFAAGISAMPGMEF